MPTKKTGNKRNDYLDDFQRLYERIGERLKELRIKKGFKSAEIFAYENEINRSQYQAWEKGMDMRISSLLRILDAHGITVKEFFAEGFE